jgi:hypothetical protein
MNFQKDLYAVDFDLTTVDGQLVNLFDCLKQNDYVLLIFLRHLG